MPYLGLPVDLKLHLWHTICRPVLTFGLETVYLNRAMNGKRESLQGTAFHFTGGFISSLLLVSVLLFVVYAIPVLTISSECFAVCCVRHPCAHY